MRFTLIFFIIIGVDTGIGEESLSLKQVLILGRHNVRESLSSGARLTQNKWPRLITKYGHLTEKGAILEGYMGEYFSKWFEQEGLFDGCPADDEVYVYANSKNRTIETADVFIKSAFKNCDIPVHHKEINTIDPVFNVVRRDTSESHERRVINEMQERLNTANLRETFEELNRILDIANSDICKEESICDLVKAKHEIIFRVGEEPDIVGPLSIGNTVVDKFMMSYYNGLPLEEIAWGHIKTAQHWKLLTEVFRQHKNIIFNTTAAAKDIAGPLLNYMSELFQYNNSKLILLVGHDINVVPVINAMGFKPITFQYHFEPFPIGGKLVFQKWANSTDEYLKVESVYQSWAQLRHGIKLYLGNAPQRIVMELRSCKIDERGLCPWSEFVNNLNF